VLKIGAEMMTNEMTYDERRAAELAANKAKADAAIALLAQVAKAMGGKWKENESEHTRLDSSVHGTITLKDIGVFVRANGYQNAGRIEFSIDWPTYKGRDGYKQTMCGHNLVNSQERAEYPWKISASQAKPAATIAKDITRRLIEPMRPVYVRALECIQERQKQCDSEQARAANFVKSFPNYTKSKEDGARMYPGSGGMPRVSLRDVSIDFDAFYCDYETGYKILELLKASKRAR
jgi:hypothetical protein